MQDMCQGQGSFAFGQVADHLRCQLLDRTGFVRQQSLDVRRRLQPLAELGERHSHTLLAVRLRRLAAHGAE